MGFGYGLFIQFPKTFMLNNNPDKFCHARTMFPNPCGAMKFIKDHNLKGNFFNTFEWGGFLEWESPDSMYFADGRTPAWLTPSQESPYKIYLKILQAQPVWEKQLEAYNINYILISPGTFLDLELKNNQLKYSWQAIYQDNRAVLYKKV
jgi:hypothetical protein